MACRLVGAKPLSEPMMEYTVNWTPTNILQWNLNRNSYIFIHENAFEHVVWKMAAIVSRSQCDSDLFNSAIAEWTLNVNQRRLSTSVCELVFLPKIVCLHLLLSAILLNLCIFYEFYCIALEWTTCSDYLCIFPASEGVTLKRHLSLAGRIHKLFHGQLSSMLRSWAFNFVIIPLRCKILTH